jgi:hypothetical protein
VRSFVVGNDHIERRKNLAQARGCRIRQHHRQVTDPEYQLGDPHWHAEDQELSRHRSVVGGFRYNQGKLGARSLLFRPYDPACFITSASSWGTSDRS